MMKDLPTKIYSESGMTQYLTRWIFELDSLIRNPSDSSTKKSNRYILFAGLVGYLECVYTCTHTHTRQNTNVKFQKQFKIHDNLFFSNDFKLLMEPYSMIRLSVALNDLPLNRLLAIAPHGA